MYEQGLAAIATTAQFAGPERSLHVDFPRDFFGFGERHRHGASRDGPGFSAWQFSTKHILWPRSLSLPPQLYGQVVDARSDSVRRSHELEPYCPFARVKSPDLVFVAGLTPPDVPSSGSAGASR